MNCLEMQEKILDSLDGGLDAIDQAQLQTHLSECSVCSRFAAAHRSLDRRLTLAISAPAFSAGFPSGLRRRLRQHPPARWENWLPDVAYMGGATAAVVLSASLLPMPGSLVLPIGVVIAIVAYAVQAVFVGVLDESS